MSQTYSAVDDSCDPNPAADWQEQMGQWPGVRVYKEHTYRLLDGLEPVLDLGCGPGLDALALGADSAIGVDPSAMCHRA